MRVILHIVANAILLGAILLAVVLLSASIAQ